MGSPWAPPFPYVLPPRAPIWFAASCSRAQYLIHNGKERSEVLPLVDHFCRESQLRIADYFRGISGNNDAVGYKLAQGVLSDAAPWLTEESVGERLLAVRVEEQDSEVVAG